MNQNIYTYIAYIDAIVIVYLKAKQDIYASKYFQLLSDPQYFMQFIDYFILLRLQYFLLDISMENPHWHPLTDLKVLTLNYCGIMNNPFEFYSQQLGKELEAISKIFDELVCAHFKLEKGSKFKWSMGKVEQKVRVGRYAPSFDINVGIHENGERFLNEKQFSECWDKAFEPMVAKSGQTFAEADVKATLTYDLIYFHTLLRYVFQKEKFEDLIHESPKKYKQVLSKFFNQSFLDEKRKLDKVVNSLFKLNFDILFMQEYSPIFEEFVRTHEKDQFAYAVDGDKDTIIVVKRASFKNIEFGDKLLSAEQRESLNWSGKTAFLIVDDIILINAHLSSSKEKNGPQIASLKEGITKLRKEKPNYHIILGGDINSFLAPEAEFDKHFNMFPRDAKAFTTIKKRTMAQGQYQKGNIPNIESKDKIISDLPIKKDSGNITFIDCHTKPSENSFVPTDTHPFDHFLVSCTVARK